MTETSLSLHFLSQITGADEQGLYVSLSSPEADVRADASSASIDLTHIAVLDLSTHNGLPAGSDLESQLFRTDSDRTLIVQAILASARAQRPSRVVVDSLTRLREMIPDVDEFRHEVLALIRGLTGLGATVLATSEYNTNSPDDELRGGLALSRAAW